MSYQDPHQQTTPATTPTNLAILSTSQAFLTPSPSRLTRSHPLPNLTLTIPPSTTQPVLTRSQTLPTYASYLSPLHPISSRTLPMDSDPDIPRALPAPPYTRYATGHDIHIWFSGDGSQHPDRGLAREWEWESDGEATTSTTSSTSSSTTSQRPLLKPTKAVEEVVVGGGKGKKNGKGRRKFRSLGKAIVASVKMIGKKKPPGGCGRGGYSRSVGGPL